MRSLPPIPASIAASLLAVAAGSAAEVAAVPLPAGVQAVWDPSAAYRETTPTRERLSINGLWRWQPARDAPGPVASSVWGYLKVPACWPGITDYMQKDFQTVYTHPSWGGESLATVSMAWYQREITIPSGWAGRRIALQMDLVNSHAIAYVDGNRVGEVRFPGGEVDLSAACRPGNTQVLSLLVTAMPLKGVMLSYNDTNSAREVKGSVARRGLCGDVWLSSTPSGPRLTEIRVTPSVRRGEVAFGVRLSGLADQETYALRVQAMQEGQSPKEFSGGPFRAGDLQEGRFSFAAPWRPQKLWDLHTPGNQVDAEVTLLDGQGQVLDVSTRQRFGFREFWIEGRDFFLNGTRVFLSAVPLDNAQVGALPASYAGARESLERLQSFGINFVYTHNYGCEPGAHLGFAEILRAADDVGMLVALSQPHFGAYDWKAADADTANGYAIHAEYYAGVAGNHPSVVAYATSHNATGYAEDMNPDLIDGRSDPRDTWARNNAALALRAEAIIQRLDPSRIVYHHSSGNLSSMHTSNFYPNWAPIQELDDWFGHWSTQGAKPVFLCEYGAPFGWDWTLYRGWYQGSRSFGSAVVPWDYCLAEWNAQFLGDRAFRISDRERTNIRWEAARFRSGNLWHRWDYPYQVGDRKVEEMEPVQSLYTTSNWRAFRTWGLSANSPWEHHRFWRLRDGVDKSRKELPVDWQALQRPGFSPDFVQDQYERMDLAFERSDWIATATAEALYRNNGPRLGYIAGGPPHFTSKDHVFLPGEPVRKQLIVINNSRATVVCDWSWSLALPTPAAARGRLELPTGEQQRLPVDIQLPADLAPGEYALTATFAFAPGETQEDAFAVHVLPPSQAVPAAAPIALLDPKGETGALLSALGARCQPVTANTDLKGSGTLVIGRGALSVEGPGPDLARVREGLKVIVFEQTAEVLEKRLGFRVAEYGLRQVFRRVPDHPLLAGLQEAHLRDWRGEATLSPPRLAYEPGGPYSGAPVVRWCGLEVPRVWRCGCRGNVASVSIEKPARGDFLPICDGGFSLQYSPLLEYREGKGMVLFCQLDVTGRSEREPAAEALVRNLLRYVAAWQLTPGRQAVYAGDPAGRHQLERCGVAVSPYQGQALTPDQLLVVAAGGGQQLGPKRAEIGAYRQAGGRLLALGLDETEANAFLPTPIRTRNEEHIAAFFEPFPSASLLAGVSPAEVHNRDPRELPLVSAGAAVAGNGVLAVAEDGGTVFCQITPDGVAPGGVGAPSRLEQQNLRRTYRRASFLLARLLGNLGVRGETPLLSCFATPPSGPGQESVVRNGDFRLDADHDGLPDLWQFSTDAKDATCSLEPAAGADVTPVLRLACPGFGEKGKGSLMLAQHEVPVQDGQWYRISFRAKAQGLDANGVTLALQNTATWQAMLEYQRFSPPETWKDYVFMVPAKGTATTGTRFQIWHGSAGTLWLADLRMAPCEPPSKGRWTEGLYADAVQEWDDPYRFFRW